MVTKTFNEEQLERAWLAQLQLEHSIICHQRRLHLATPLFELTDNGEMLGSYESSRRVLRLSRDLICNHSWRVTLQVLRHEMAHQLCAEGFAGQGAPHGDSFQDACEILGVEPLFRRARVDREVLAAAAAIGQSETGEGNRCLAKVEKLLALAGSQNEHEAELAMAKANELLEKNHLQGLLHHEKRQFLRRTIEPHRKRMPTHVRKICGILQEFFHVRLVVADEFHPASGESYKIIDMYGTYENVAVAEYCYHFLEERLDHFWRQQRGEFHGQTRIEKKSFYLGLLTGFGERLAAERQPRQRSRGPEVMALVVAEDRRLQEHVSSQYDQLTTSRSRSLKVYQDSFASGRQTGKKLTLNRPVSRGGVKNGKMLGYRKNKK